MDVPVPLDRSVYTRLEIVARRSWNTVALRCGARILSYGDLLTSVADMAARLRAAGIRSGVSFAVLCENNLDVLIAYYAAAHLNAVFVPVNPGMSARETAHIVSHSDAVLLLYGEEVRDVAEGAVDASRRQSLRDFLRSPLPQTAATDTSVPDVCSSAQSGDFLIIYTSGSTGTPKGVVFDQASEVEGNASLIAMWNIGASDVTLVALPLGFLYGLSTAAATGLQAGGEVVVLPKFRPGDVLAALIEHRVTVFHGVPTMFSMMLEYSEQQNETFDLSGVRQLISAGASLPAELRSRFADRFSKHIDDYYALTEVRPVFGRQWADETIVPSGAIGKAAPGADIRIVGTDEQSLPAGEHGEVVVHAPATFKRYHKDDELTSRVLQDGYLRTGDLGYRDFAGHFYLTGRLKDTIIRGGANIAPAEVENIIASHPAVQSIAVIGAPDPRFGEIVVAYVTLRSGSRASAEQLRDFCTDKLAAFKIPAAFVFIPELPVGVTAKVDKQALRTRWLAQHS
jgi:long-chain acyl-CoA synthetase